MYSSHEKIIEDTKEQYYISLRQTQSSWPKKTDLNPWFLYFLKTIAKQAEYLRDQVAVKKPGSLTQKGEKVFDTIQKYQPVTIGFLERETSLKRVTLKAILAKMKAQGLIVMQGERKASRYRVR